MRIWIYLLRKGAYRDFLSNKLVSKVFAQENGEKSSDSYKYVFKFRWFQVASPGKETFSGGGGGGGGKLVLGVRETPGLPPPTLNETLLSGSSPVSFCLFLWLGEVASAWIYLLAEVASAWIYLLAEVDSAWIYLLAGVASAWIYLLAEVASAWIYYIDYRLLLR